MWMYVYVHMGVGFWPFVCMYIMWMYVYVHMAVGFWPFVCMYIICGCMYTCIWEWDSGPSYVCILCGCMYTCIWEWDSGRSYVCILYVDVCIRAYGSGILAFGFLSYCCNCCMYVCISVSCDIFSRCMICMFAFMCARIHVYVCV